MDEAHFHSGSQLSLELTPSPTSAGVEEEPVLVAPDGRVIDAQAITQAVKKAQARAAERARRREQVRRWRAGR